MVQSTRDTAQHKDGGSGQSSCGGSIAADKAHVVEDEGEGCGCKHFEETFHPQVNHPPTPVFHYRNRRMLAVEQAGRIEHTHTEHGSHKNGQQVFIGIFLFKRSKGTANHQEQPQQQADHQQQLPETAQVQELITLVAEPEVHGRRHIVAQGKEVAAVRTQYHDKQCDIQEVHACTLEFRIFTAVDNRSQEQTRSQEACGNPENCGLNVPSTCQGIRQPIREVDAVEMLAFNGVVSSQTAQQHLCHKQGDSQEYIFAQSFLRRSQLDFRQRIFCRRLHLFMFGQERVTPQQ